MNYQLVSEVPEMSGILVETLPAPYPSPLRVHNSEVVAPQISLARTQDDLKQAFGLLYRSYVSAGLASSNSVEMRVTPYHALPTTEVFVAKVRGEVISTLTMTDDNAWGLPMESMYGQEIAKLRSSKRIAEMGCFADRRESPARFMRVFSALSRFIVQTAHTRGIAALVLAAHPRHAKFYERILGFQQLGGLTSCPYAQGNPAVALVMDFDSLRGTAIHERLFGEPIEPEQLEPTAWTIETTNYLRMLAEQQHQHLPLDRPRIAG